MFKSYELTVAEPFLCVAAVLAMVLKAEGFQTPDQFEIAEYFGVNLPPGQVGRVLKSQVADDPKQWGIIVPREGLGKFFARFGIDLKEQFMPINQFQDWEFADAIERHLVANHHIVCGFSYHSLCGKSRSDEGHIALVLSIDGEWLTLLDPGPRDAGIKTVELVSFYRAVHSRRDGLWVIARS